MSEDDHDSDDEPIAHRKRPVARSNRRVATPPDDAKRRKHDDALSAANERRPETVCGAKLREWTPEMRSDVDETALVADTTPRAGAKTPSFLLPDVRRDAEGRRPDEPDYDPSTLFIPPTWFEEARISAGQRQWWTFKAAHFDAVLLFKVGKFYEMYEMDAHVGVELLGLKYMKGEQPHCGFPEAAYAEMTARLVQKGSKVVVVEQTETPEALKKRNAALKDQKKPTEKVVRRAKVAVLTRGTVRDAEMLEGSDDAQYLMAIYAARRIGFAAVDVATNRILLAQFDDDDLLSTLRTHIAVLDPVEFLLRGEDDATGEKLVGAATQAAPSARINCRGATPSQTAEVEALTSYFGQDGADLPELLATVLASPETWTELLAAFGEVLSFLKAALLDEAVIPVSTYHLLSSPGSETDAAPECVVLDSSALENLEIFRDSSGRVGASLFASLDHCFTPFGRRCLRGWVSRPLARSEEIRERQDAVQDLLTTGAAAVARARRELSTVGDLERIVVRLHTATLSKAAQGRDADYVVLYEDAVQRRVKDFVKALKGLHSLAGVVANFAELAAGFVSPLLRRLVSPGAAFPRIDGPLETFLSVADWTEVGKTGQIPLPQGYSEAYDAAKTDVGAAKNSVAEYAADVGKQLGAEVALTSYRKQKFVLEVDAKRERDLPRTFTVVSRRQGFVRFTDDRLEARVAEVEAAEDAEKRARNGVLHGLLCAFSEHRPVWLDAVDAVAQLDALISLSIAAVSIPRPSCRPVLRPGGAPIFRAAQLRHPNLSVKGSAFVANDVCLGDDGRFMILTGANMGGKSTLMRQVCLATLLAQIGAFVPAASLELTPVDGIFVRMGAKDRIVCGQSTFFVELSDTATMLTNATSRSLVALDELGRGTATSDGEAIAYAVMEHLTKEIGCLGILATHYHGLAAEFASRPEAVVRHMACETQGDDVKFLYELRPGVAPRSYGMQVARMAGLDEGIVRRAHMMAGDAEARLKTGNDV